MSTPGARVKVTATGAVLLAHAALVIGLDVLMGFSIGGTGILAWGTWSSSHDLATTATLAGFALLQVLVLMGSVLAAGFEALAAMRALRGDARVLRPAALLAIALPAVWTLVAIPGVSCFGALFWTIPLVLGIVALALAREVDEELPEPRRDW